jgi:hypothetical protein
MVEVAGLQLAYTDSPTSSNPKPNRPKSLLPTFQKHNRLSKEQSTKQSRKQLYVCAMLEICFKKIDKKE